ncbi:MAG: hypothetical protein PF590_05890 [Candidatus Delongbacteria bacterium]|nr:hypothetical protein [Candidatus Delongbacteria bacterium]
MKNITVIAIVLFLTNFSLAAQELENTDYIDDQIMDINQHMKDVVELTDDTAKIEANDLALELMRDMLIEPDAFEYQYDSLEHITILESNDGRVRIFTWNIMYDNMRHDFFGFIQYVNEDGEYHHYELKDKTSIDPDADPDYESPDEWYGAIYYEMIEEKHKDTPIYTLLGWKGQDALVQQKVIETLEFNHRDEPEFGGRRLKVVREKMDRAIFRYSSQAQMIIRFNEKNDIIVCDHLSPGNPKFKGQYEYYGPDYSYDAFEFDGKRWVYKSNIDPNIAINYKKNRKIEKRKKQNPSKDF